MMRHEFTPDGWPASHSLDLHWDRPWRAFVALIYDRSLPPMESIILRVGCKPPHDRYPDLDGLLTALNAAIAGKLPAATLPKALRKALLDDQRSHYDDLQRRGIDPAEPMDFSNDGDEDDEDFGPSLAYPPLYVIRSADRCPECGQAQHVYTLGCAAYRDAEDGGDEPIEVFHILRYVLSMPEPVSELLKKKVPSFYLDTAEPGEISYLMNHCPCGAKLDEEFISGDVGAAFMPETPDGYRSLELFRLPVDEPIPLESSYVIGGGEYMDFGKAEKW